MEDEKITIYFNELCKVKNIIKAITNIQNIIREDDLVEHALAIRYTMADMSNTLLMENDINIIEKDIVEFPCKCIYIYKGLFYKNNPWDELEYKMLVELFRICGYHLENVSQNNLKIFKLSKEV